MHTLSAIVDRRIPLPVWFVGTILIAAFYIFACKNGTPAHYSMWADVELAFTLQILPAAHQVCRERCTGGFDGRRRLCAR